jgi:Fur family iron response transcriptional regulator
MNNRLFGFTKREIAEVLRAKGINPTTQRIEIAHFLLSEPQHLSAEEILQKINNEYEQVSQATVYNTLRLFVEKAVIRELIFSSDRIYYDSNTDMHHHFIDVDTGIVYDIPNEALNLAKIDIQGLGAHILEVSRMVKGRVKTNANAVA